VVGWMRVWLDSVWMHGRGVIRGSVEGDVEGIVGIGRHLNDMEMK
jgi:hypothetical protein